MTPVTAAKKLSKFDPKTFLTTIDGGRKIATFLKKQPIFVQGDPSDAVFYIQKGKVKLTVVSTIGKEATIGILNEGDFFGEGCLTGQALRLCCATAITDCSVMRID
jgi:CRP/FNR family cyclic AMP-dependent transcriptional regulator